MKQLLAILLSVGLLFQGATPAFAGKSYSSGRSFSSGSSSSGRSFSSGSSSSGRSFSSGGSKSYSSGGSSKPSFSSGSKSYSSGGSKPSGSSFSGGSKPSGSSYSSGSKPSGSSFSGGSSSKPSSVTPGSSGKSYSSGGSSKPSGGSPSVTPGSSGKSYSSGGSSKPPVVTDNGGGNSRKPGSGSGGFNSGLSSAGRKQESQTRYEAATKPKETYTSKGADGKTVQQNIKPDSPQVQTVRRYVTHERYVTYDNRASVFYGGYYGSPMYYHDPFSPFLMGWIMSDAINSHQRALWMYHHQSDMDSARYQAMLAKDAKLQAEIDQLKAQNLARDPSYVPPQMAENPDLMFNKDFVDASYNPVAVEEEAAASEGGSGGMWVVIILLILVLGGVVVYYLFVKEY